MKGLLTVVKKEWMCFIGGDRGIFLLYGILILTWSFLLASGDDSTMRTGPLWLVFFSVVIAANFSNTVFISERITGALEILITSGLSRNAILFGKMAFIMGMSLMVGGACMLLGMLWCVLLFDTGYSFLTISDYLIFAASAFVNVSSSAFLSVRMANPRLLHFTNLFLLGGIVFVYTILSHFYPVPVGALLLVLSGFGSVCTILAQREFSSERILQPVLF